jgi:hypothetical protein
MKKDNRVELPREVVEHIESLTTQGYKKFHLMRLAFAYEFGKPGRELHEYALDNFETYFAALVNGYTIAGTPEQKVANHAVQLREDMMRWKEPQVVDEARWQLKGVEKTLDLLGIKIEGVNA